MPIELEKKITKLLVYQSLELVLIILGIVSLAFFGVAITKNMFLTIMCFFALLCCSALILLLWSKRRTIQAKSAWRLKVRQTDLKSMAACEQVNANAYVAFLQAKRYTVRVLVLNLEQFSRDYVKSLLRKSNRTINRLYKISAEVPFEEAHHSGRINAIILPCENPEAVRWVEADTELLLSRVEGIVKILLLQDTQELIIPDIPGNLTILQLEKYRQMIKLMCLLLSD